jgi:inositol phosphorylceramide synthase catalytic subunit
MILINNRFTKVILANAIFLIFTFLLTGIKAEHLILSALCSFLYLYGKKTRKFILAFGIFVIFAIIYDLMKAWPNYQVNQVDISALYHFEQNLFGFSENGHLITPNEFFTNHHTSFLDIISGIFYINWIPVPLALAVYFYLTNKKQYLDFALTFFFVNLIGFCIYYIHPAAPPWYVQLYGFDMHLGVPGNTAGLSRFDTLVHLPVFASIYAENSNVFAAMPSLHCAYPVIVLYYGMKNKLGWVNGLFGLFMTGIWFAAVYSGHHYVTDVIAGVICACVGILIYQRVFLKTGLFQKWISDYKHAIT